MPNPLHPALVHFPIVFMVLLPIAAAVSLWAIRQGARHSRAWLVPLAFAVALSGSAWLAVETGEQQEERVEDVVPEGAVEHHAGAAEQFLLLSIAVTGLVALGLLRGRPGQVARGVAVAAAAALTIAGYRVGHSGGELVYRHGAGSAYAGPAGAASRDAALERGRGGEEEESERR